MRLLRLLYILPVTILFIGFFHPITAYNQDLGRHLITGKIILQTLHVPSINLFSYTFPTFPFINHHWGSEIIFYLTKTFSGDIGLFILSLILIGLAWLTIFQFVAKRAHPLPLTLLAIIYLRVLLERTDLRPELFSFLILSIMVTILYQYREHFTKLIFLLIPLEVLWANLHIYFPIGVLVILLFVVDDLIIHRRNLWTKYTKTLLLVFILTGVATLFNPHFISGATYPLRVFQNYGYTIEENQTPFFLQSLGFHKPSFLYLGLALSILFSSLAISWKKTRIVDWLLSIALTLIALSAVRNFPLFVFVTFIPASLAFNNTLSTSIKWLKNKPPIFLITACLILISFFGWQIRTILGFNGFGYGIREDGKKALNFFKENNISGPIFNNFDIGSYIEYRLYPSEKIFIDGRPEAYPSQFIQDTYIKMQEDPSLFTKVSKNYEFNSIIFSHTDQTPWAEKFIRDITLDPDWSTVYLDPTMIILLKKLPQNNTLIQKYGFSPSSDLFPLPHDERGLRLLGHFYGSIGATTQLGKVLQGLLSISPNDCSTLRNLSSLYNQTNNSLAPLYTQRLNMTCPL